MTTDSADRNASNASLGRRLILMAVAMFGFGFLLVPIYDVFCEITGLGGKTNQLPASVAAAPDTTRQVQLMAHPTGQSTGEGAKAPGGKRQEHLVQTPSLLRGGRQASREQELFFVA